MIRHFLTKEFLRFLLVGATAAIGNWIFRIVFNLWTDSFVLSVVGAYAVAVIIAFGLNKIYVFPNSNQSLKNQIRYFALVNFISFWAVLASAVLIKQFLKYLGMPHYTSELAHFIAIAIPMFGSFLIYKFFAFKQ